METIRDIFLYACGTVVGICLMLMFSLLYDLMF